jgi:tetratricopeptide (TPR) repeat protein
VIGDAGAGGGPGWRNELGGEVRGPVVQAQAVHGDVYMGGNQPRRLPVPSQLPREPAHFVGRSTELGLLHRLAGQDLVPSVTVVSLTGPGGAGKTSLALHWLHKVRESYPGGQLHADLGGVGPRGPTSPAEVLGRFLRALGMPPDQLPATVDEQVALYRSATQGRRIIVLLDDAASAAQVRTLLPSPGPSLVVVTTRRRLAGLAIDGARFIDVMPLDEQAAVELFSRIVGADRALSQPDAVRTVVQLCGRLPLAICVSAARLALHPHWPVRHMAEELRSRQDRLSALSIEDDVSIRASFDVSSQALPDSVALAYRLLSLIPAPSFSLGPAAAATGTGDAAADRLLRGLVEASLLEETGEQRWQFHDLIALHAREQAQTDSEKIRRNAIDRILDWYLRAAVAADLVVIPGRWHLGSYYQQARKESAAFSEPAEALNWLDDELPGLLAAVLLAHDQGLHDKAWQLCEALWGVLVFQRRYQSWDDALAAGVASAQVVGDPRAEARLHVYIGFMCLHLGQIAQARERFGQALALDRSAGHQLGEATALENLGLASMAAGEPSTGLGYFTQARLVHEQIGHLRGTALMIRRIGAAQSADGQHKEAIRNLADARRRFAIMGDRYNEARALASLAEAHLRAGSPDEAESLLTEALEAAHGLGSRHEQARIHVLLADTARQVGHAVRERDHLLEALRAYEDIAAPQADPIRARLATLGPAPS